VGGVYDNLLDTKLHIYCASGLCPCWSVRVWCAALKWWKQQNNLYENLLY